MTKLSDAELEKWLDWAEVVFAGGDFGLDQKDIDALSQLREMLKEREGLTEDELFDIEVAEENRREILDWLDNFSWEIGEEAIRDKIRSLILTAPPRKKVSMEEVIGVVENAVSEPDGGTTDFIVNWLRSIGVSVEEEK